MKVRIKSLFLATILAVSMTGCAVQEDNNFSSVEESSYEQIIDQNNLQNRMINFIETIENSDIGLDLASFYNNARTLQIITDINRELNYNSFYDKDANVLVINTSDKGVFEHELVHVILNNGKELGNDFLEEGFTELVSSEICGNANSYCFNVGVCKILTTLLGKDKMIDTFNNKDLNIITNCLSGITFTEQDAIVFLEYCNEEHTLSKKMHEAFYKDGNLESFKNTSDFNDLRDVRSKIIDRIKKYIKDYYYDLVRQDNIDVESTLIDMIALLNVVDKELYDPALECERKNDFFLRDEVDYLVEKYQLDQNYYDKCYTLSKSKKYLFIFDSFGKKLIK